MAVLFIAQEMEEELNRHMRRETVFRDRLNPLDAYDDLEIRRKYRLSRELILQLCNDCAIDLEPQTNRNHALPVTLQVFTTLRLLASGSFQEVLGDAHGISKSTVSRKLHVVCQAICHRWLHRYVKFPTTGNEMRPTKEDMYDIAEMPNSLGAVDGCLIPTKAPSVDEHLYVSRKGGHAMNIQVVCNAKLIFTNVVVQYAATTHDSYIWTNCALCQQFENGQYGDSWLLGDSGYVIFI